jgi:hypothetical protein
MYLPASKRNRERQPALRARRAVRRAAAAAAAAAGVGEGGALGDDAVLEEDLRLVPLTRDQRPVAGRVVAGRGGQEPARLGDRAERLQRAASSLSRRARSPWRARTSTQLHVGYAPMLQRL